MAILHLKYPLEVINGSFATIEQDTTDYFIQCAQVVLTTPVGWLDLEPDLGLDEQQFLHDGVDLDEIERQLNTYVPELESLPEEDLDRLVEALAVVGVHVDAASRSTT